ncbi:amidohydrolase [Phaeocystidibacter marisrubri]|uniref:Omega-amidase YafV n=1 Tax=Phaeocystidibacter marisrubri TaxID=1577780 RepID=A0A6L3ZFI0_9FLAO|nr:amidohydrolase [Phaeocystidibacter marisrubri]KAB2816182.1 amidohydrolase [Phaeocystidibacter marisrubri]GGH67729.1 hydrolase [Phaeocystidibacter marisrubri]
MNELHVSLVQTSLHWEDAKLNRQMFDEHLSEIQKTDVIFLPEMFSTGFSMRPSEVAEPMSGETVTWMKEKAKALNAVVTGSVVITENGKFYNRLIWAEPSGEIKHYDKRHRFSYAGEHEEYSAGQTRSTWEYKGWRIRPQICYDLRFPVWARNDDDYDLLFYVANWPARRSYPWKSLLVARAIENMSYVVGLNRVGEDGNGIDHSGDSVVLNPLGETVSAAQPNTTEVVKATLSKSDLSATRERFRFLNDRDTFTLD